MHNGNMYKVQWNSSFAVCRMPTIWKEIYATNIYKLKYFCKAQTALNKKKQQQFHDNKTVQICECNCACAKWSMYTWNSYEVEYVIVNTYLLLRSLKTVGKKEFFSLVLLDLTLLYLWPEGRSVNRSCWGWVEALRMEAALLWTLRCRCSAEKAVESWWSSLQPLTLSAGVCGPQQKCCRTTRWYSRSRCSQQCSCRSCWGSQAMCQTSSASSENTAAVGPSLPAVWCWVTKRGRRWSGRPGI